MPLPLGIEEVSKMVQNLILRNEEHENELPKENINKNNNNNNNENSNTKTKSSQRKKMMTLADMNRQSEEVYWNLADIF